MCIFTTNPGLFPTQLANMIIRLSPQFNGVDIDSIRLTTSEENFTTFLFANFPYIISAVALNNNTPFRRPFWTNRTIYVLPSTHTS